MDITLPPALERLVREKVDSGMYASESDLICEALCHEFAFDSGNLKIQEQAAEGFAQLDTGEYEDINREELLSRLKLRSKTASCA